MEHQEKSQCCDNCGSHNPYKYAAKMFCSKRYAQNKDPIVGTLRCCSNWDLVSQRCHCVRDALNKKNGE
jgi:hypothetical protein